MLELAISLEMISIGPSKISPFVHFSDFRVLGIRGLGGAQEGLKREHGSLNGQRRAPLVLQNVQANGARLARHIWVPHFRQKLALRRLERIPVWNHDVDLIRMHS